MRWQFLGVIEAHERTVLSRQELAASRRLLPLLIDKFGGYLLELLFVRDGTELLLPTLLARFLRENQWLKALRPSLIMMHLTDINTCANIVLFFADIYGHQSVSQPSFLSPLLLSNERWDAESLGTH